MDRVDLVHAPGTPLIRDASLDDVAALLGFDPMAQAGDLKRCADIQAWVEAGYTLVAVSPVDVVGYVSTLPAHLFARDFVALLVVHPDHRRRGVGTALLKAAIEQAASSRVFTSTNASNTPMKALLASSGWVKSGTLDGFDPRDPEEFYFIDRNDS